MGNNNTDAGTESHHGVSHTLPAMTSQSMASTCQYDFPNPSTSDAPNYSPGNPIPHLSSAMSDMQSSDSDSDEDDVPFVPSFQDAISHHSHAILSDQEISSSGTSHGQNFYINSPRPSHAPLNKAVWRLLDSSLAPSTKCGYKNALEHFRNFHDTYYPSIPLLPVSTEQLAQFIVVCVNRNLKASTIISYTSDISYIHKLHNMVSPSESFVIKKLIHSIRRTTHSDKRRPFTVDAVQKIVTSLVSTVSDNFTHILMRAMFLLAFFGLFRVGELAYSVTGFQNVLQREDITFQSKHGKVSYISLTIKNYKHSNGQVSVISIARQQNKSICPVRAMLRYLRLSSQGHGQLFRHIDGAPVTTTFFRTVLRSCVLHNKMDPKLYTAHSFRIGGATHAHMSQMPASQIKKLGRWKSTAYIKYIRPSALPIHTRN